MTNSDTKIFLNYKQDLIRQHMCVTTCKECPYYRCIENKSACSSETTLIDDCKVLQTHME